MSVTVVVDFVAPEDKVATVGLENGEIFDLPLSILPKNIKEGDYLSLELSLDLRAKKEAELDLDVGGIQRDPKIFYGKFRENF